MRRKLGDQQMDIIHMIPALWDLMKRKKVAVNITNLDNELTISIIRKRNIFGRRKITRFRHSNNNVLIADITRYLQT